MQGQQPSEECQAAGSREEEPSRSAFPQPEKGQIAADDFRNSGNDEQSEGSRVFHKHVWLADLKDHAEADLDAAASCRGALHGRTIMRRGVRSWVAPWRTFQATLTLPTNRPAGHRRRSARTFSRNYHGLHGSRGHGLPYAHGFHTPNCLVPPCNNPFVSGRCMQIGDAFKSAKEANAEAQTREESKTN